MSIQYTNVCLVSVKRYVYIMVVIIIINNQYWSQCHYWTRMQSLPEHSRYFVWFVLFNSLAWICRSLFVRCPFFFWVLYFVLSVFLFNFLLTSVIYSTLLINTNNVEVRRNCEKIVSDFTGRRQHCWIKVTVEIEYI
jgi:hypothetical protein